MSGRTALMNFATKLMRSRTELMFQVVSLRRTGGSEVRGRTTEGGRRRAEIASHLLVGQVYGCLSLNPSSVLRPRSSVLRRLVCSRIALIIDHEQVRVRLLRRVEIEHRNRGVEALRIGDGPLL